MKVNHVKGKFRMELNLAYWLLETPFLNPRT